MLTGLANQILQAVRVDAAIEHQRVHADGLQVVQPLGNAFQIAGSITVCILKSRWVDAVKDSAVPPAFGRNAGACPTRTRKHLG